METFCETSNCGLISGLETSIDQQLNKFFHPSAHVLPVVISRLFIVILQREIFTAASYHGVALSVTPPPSPSPPDEESGWYD